MLWLPGTGGGEGGGEELIMVSIHLSGFRLS